MGYGDFKLLAALGAWLGWRMLLPIVMCSAAVGSVVGITLIVVAPARRATCRYLLARIWPRPGGWR